MSSNRNFQNVGFRAESYARFSNAARLIEQKQADFIEILLTRWESSSMTERVKAVRAWQAAKDKQKKGIGE